MNPWVNALAPAGGIGALIIALISAYRAYGVERSKGRADDRTVAVKEVEMALAAQAAAYETLRKEVARLGALVEEQANDIAALEKRNGDLRRLNEVLRARVEQWEGRS
jgi:prophage DNA circulation protein